MTTPDGPYRVEKRVGAAIVVGPDGPFVPLFGSLRSSAPPLADMLNTAHHSARAPLLELLRECVEAHEYDVAATTGGSLPADLLTRIRAALTDKETKR